MRLNEITPEIVEELKENLEFLGNKAIQDAFKDPLFPHLNTSVPGTVDAQSTPNWYTRIHDVLETALVEYDRQDIEEGSFLEVKMLLRPKSLDVYLYQAGRENPSVILKLEADVKDIESGTFNFGSELIQEVQVVRRASMSVA